MFLTSLYKNRKNEKLWKFPLFEGFSPQLIYILKCLISQWIVFIVYYQISIIILVYHSWLTRKRPISNETPGLEYRRVHLNSIGFSFWIVIIIMKLLWLLYMWGFDKEGEMIIWNNPWLLLRVVCYLFSICESL